MTTGRRRRIIVCGALAVLAAGIAPLPIVDGVAAQGSQLTTLEPSFSAPMAAGHSASVHRQPQGGATDSRFVGAAPRQDRSCQTAHGAAVVRPGGRSLARNGCAATAHGRAAAADDAYRHPHPQALDADVGAEVPHAALAGGPPPTYPSPNWIQLQPSSAPTGRYGNAIAYDDLHQQVVLFGGYDGTTFFNDTWTWNGTTWTQQYPATSPPARMWTQMAYDAATQTVILFGGESLTTPAMSDTWSWNGTTWTQLSPTTSPPGRGEAALAYDPQISKVVLFGGSGYTSGGGAYDLGDTWTFNGATWTQVTSTPAPAVRSGPRAAYDAVHQNLVLFGGMQASGSFLGDTWTFDGTAWTLASPIAAPSARAYEYLSADPGLPGVVLFGGYDPTMGDTADTWRWDGSGWALAAGITSPSGRDGGAMAFYAPLGQLVQFGGSDGFTNFAQTWTYSTGSPTITDSVSSGTASRGTLVTYTVVVGNPSSTSAMTNVGMSDTLPTGLVVASTVPALTITDVGTGQPISCSNCSASGQTVNVSGLTIATLDSVRIVFQAVAVGLDRGCAQLSDSATASVAGLATPPVSAPVTVCDSGLGIQPWRSQATRTVGPQGSVAVDAADGNMVVTQLDGTVIPDRGMVDFGLTRTYNSEASGLQAAPASLGAGWGFTVGQEKIAAGGPTANGLVVPSAESYANNLPVTFVDGTGARSVFLPRAGFQPLDITGIVWASPPVTSPLGALKPRQIATNFSVYDHVCVDVAYTAPPGIHLSLLRYIVLNAASSSTPCTPAANTTPQVLGFMAERPDRVRDEFSTYGNLVDVLDGNGNELRYSYDSTPWAGMALGHLDSVTNGSGDRGIQFTYPSATETDVTDPAGRVTRYQFDTSTPPKLTTVINPGGSHLAYTYGGCHSATASQLCSATDPRGATTSFGYETVYQEQQPFVGPPHIETITDRTGVPTTISYHATNDYVTADVASERTSFGSPFDTSGRAGVISYGDTSWNTYRYAVYTWDTPSNACRQPDALVDNNLCRVVRQTFSSTPDQDTSLIYNAEGRTLVEREAVSSGLVRYKTAGYSNRYLTTSGTFSSYGDGVAGSGAVTSIAGHGQGGQRIDAQTLLYLSDLVQTLPYRGNAVGGAYASYVTTYHLDNNAAKNPNMALGGGACANPGVVAGNTGDVCEVDAPTFDGTTPTRTQVVYNSAGQPVSITSPKAIAEAIPPATPPATTYTYYGSSDHDLSGTVTAAGWLKGVTDPAGSFVAVAYDAAGNVTRTWDRDATQGHALSEFPGALASPPSTAYTETMHGSYASPWRYAVSQRDQLGDLTTITLDANGNQTAVRPPRGNAASTSVYDTLQTFDARDELLTTQLPAERAAGAHWIYTYDAAGNRTSSTDPNGNVTVQQYDPANRLVATLFTRGPWPYDLSTVPPACRQSTGSDTPIPAGRILCSTTGTYDGVDNVLSAQDANHQTTTFTFNAVHERLTTVAPRNDGTFTTLTTATVYDLAGNVTDLCPPREYTEGSATCSASAVFGKHTTYDLLDRPVSTTTYRATGQSETTAQSYDADGNVIATTDANGHTTTTQVDLLDRKIAQTVPRDASSSTTTTWQYDPAGAVTAEVRPGNLITAYSYDAAHRQIDTVEGADNTTSAAAGLPDATGGSNIRTRVAYDADGHVAATFDPRAFSSSTTSPDYTFSLRTDYDADGRPSATFVPRYDSGAHSDLGLTASQTAQCTTASGPAPVSGLGGYPPGVAVCVTRYQYDNNGNRSRAVLPTSNGSDNRYYAYSYTDDNLIDHVDAPSPDPGSGARVTAAAFVYDGDGKQVKSTDALGHQTTTAYTSDELVKQTTEQPNGAITHITSYTYDANGNRVGATDPAGNHTTSAYFADNLLRSTSDALSDTTSYIYDGVGNTAQITSPSAAAHDASNPSGTPTVNTYTFDNLLATATTPVSPDGSQRRQTVYGYDTTGRKTSQDTRLVTASGGLISDAGTQSFSYFNDGRLHVQTGRDGNTITTTYDPAGNRTQINDSSGGGSLGTGSTISATYFLDDRPRTVDDGTWTTKYSYDGVGSTGARSDAKDGSSVHFTTDYAYGDAELPVLMNAPAIATSPTTGSSSTSFTYDVAGHPRSEVDPNGQTRALTFNPDDTLASVVVTSRTGTTLANWSYSYDNDRRQLSQTFTGASASSAQSPVQGTFSYTYDAAGRVSSYTQWTLPGGNTTQPVTWDHNGDRLQVGSTHWSYNADGSIASTQSGTLPAQTYSYSAAGELSSDACATYQYDGFGRLANINQQASMNCPAPSPGTTTYAYDGLDRQRGRADGTATPTFYHADGLSDQVTVETGPGAIPGVTTAFLASEIDPSGRRYVATQTATDGTPSTVAYLADDGFLNISTVTGTDGSVACTARFDAFGVAQGALSTTNPCNTGSTVDKYFYRSARADTATGHYYFGSRMYDPVKGTFDAPDTYRAAQPDANLGLMTDPLTANGFAYANGDPVNFWDPTGHNPCRNDDCTADENRALAASDRGADTSGSWAPSPSGRPRTYGSPYHPPADPVVRARANGTAHLMDINEQRTTTLGAGTGLGATIDLLRVPSYAQGMGDVFQGCVNCSGSRFVDGRLYKWNGNMQTWVCGDADASGTNCGESATYRFNWQVNKVEQYDDNARQGGFIGFLHGVQNTIGRADSALAWISSTAGKVSSYLSLAAGACGAGAFGATRIPVIGGGVAAVLGACSATTGVLSVASLQVAVGADLVRAAGGHGNPKDLVLDSLAESVYGLQRGVNAGIKAVDGLAGATRETLKRMNDILNGVRSVPTLIPTFSGTQDG